MYHTREQFEAAILTDDPIYTDEDLASIEEAWLVYQAASGQAPRQADGESLNCLVLGRKANEHFVGVGIDDVLKANFGTMNDDNADGAVLQMPAVKWTYLVNDAWVLGGVHSHKPFYIASERSPENICAINSRRLTVTARELTGLKSFGYNIHFRQGLGEVAVCVDTDLADMASFETYNQCVVLYATDEAWTTNLLAPEFGGPAVVTIN
jgi:hypothetical protein